VTIIIEVRVVVVIVIIFGSSRTSRCRGSKQLHVSASRAIHVSFDAHISYTWIGLDGTCSVCRIASTVSASNALLLCDVVGGRGNSACIQVVVGIVADLEPRHQIGSQLCSDTPKAHHCNHLHIAIIVNFVV
jgi:hypothetical protein